MQEKACQYVWFVSCILGKVMHKQLTIYKQCHYHVNYIAIATRPKAPINVVIPFCIYV